MNQLVSNTELTGAQETTVTHEGYMPGFGNDFETEALSGALPQGMNSPQKCNYGLYGEQLSGTAFTQPKPERTWCYRIRPSVHPYGYLPVRILAQYRDVARMPASVQTPCFVYLLNPS